MIQQFMKSVFRARIWVYMVIIVVIAFGMYCIVLKNRHDFFLRRAALHEMLSHQYFYVDGGEGIAASLKELEDHHLRLREKYKYAASHPWLAVEPDPPGAVSQFEEEYILPHFK